MNFLRDVGKRFSRVTEEINENLGQLRLKASLSSSTSDSAVSNVGESASVELTGGGRLLDHYQSLWAAVHVENEAIAASAARVDRMATRAAGVVKSRRENFSRLQREAAELPRTLASLQCIAQLLESLELNCQSVEHELALLENQVECGEFRSNQHRHNYQLLEYSRRRQEDLERRRVQLAQRHASKVQRLEASRQLQLRERQLAFEEEFKRDVEFFKEHGRTQREPSVTSQTLADVADLEPPIEADDALKEFLEAEEEDEDDVDPDDAFEPANEAEAGETGREDARDGKDGKDGEDGKGAAEAAD